VYCIRRPCRSQMRKPLYKELIDFLMLPVRFAEALFNFVRIFTEAFRNRPDLAEGPEPRFSPPGQYVTVLGEVIDIAKARKARPDKDRSLVPDTWQLVKLAPGKDLEVIAKSVCCYDLAADGRIVFTNGFTIHHIDGEGGSSVAGFELIQQVRCLSTGTT